MTGLIRGVADLMILGGGTLLILVGFSIWVAARLRRHLVRLGLLCRVEGTTSRFPGASRRWVLVLPWNNPGWWRAQLARRNMWQEVLAAERAVAEARRCGAPVGELPSLSRELHKVADRAESLLLVRGSHSESSNVLAVLTAARQIRSSAIHAMDEFAGLDAVELANRCRLEADALAVGTARWRKGQPIKDGLRDKNGLAPQPTSASPDLWQGDQVPHSD